MTVLAEFQVRSESCAAEQWLDVWGVRARDARQGEPETLAYAAAQATEDSSRVLVFERYGLGQSSLDRHVARDAHAELLSTMGAHNMTRRRVMSNRFSDIPGYGWWGRSGQGAAAVEAGLPMMIFGTRFDSQEMLEGYLALTGEHARYCHEAEPGTLVYSAGIAQGDADRGPEIEAGDLLFVAVFADKQATTVHRDDPRHLALQDKLSAIDRERTFLQTYTTTGKGYLWR